MDRSLMLLFGKFRRLRSRGEKVDVLASGAVLWNGMGSFYPLEFLMNYRNHMVLGIYLFDCNLGMAGVDRIGRVWRVRLVCLI